MEQVRQPIPATVAFLIESVRSAPSADNSQPWCLGWDGAELRARVVRRGGFPDEYPATTIALGAAAENLSSALRTSAIDQSAWWMGPPAADGLFARGPVPALARREPFTPPHDSAGNAPTWLRRHTNRHPYRSRVPAEALQALADCRVGDCSIVVLREAAMGRAAAWVRAASAIRFRTREVNEWFAASLRFANDADRDEGLDVATLALPPGAATVLRWLSDWPRLERANRFGAYKAFAAIEAANFRKAPAALAVIGPSSRQATFDAGRCLQRAWLRATDAGLSGQPYYVVADLLHRLGCGGVPHDCVAQGEAVRRGVRAEFGEDRTLHCLLRIGVPIRTGPVSGRRALERILCPPV